MGLFTPACGLGMVAFVVLQSLRIFYGHQTNGARLAGWFGPPADGDHSGPARALGALLVWSLCGQGRRAGGGWDRILLGRRPLSITARLGPSAMRSCHSQARGKEFLPRGRISGAFHQRGIGGPKVQESSRVRHRQTTPVGGRTLFTSAAAKRRAWAAGARHLGGTHRLGGGTVRPAWRVGQRLLIFALRAGIAVFQT